MYIRNYAVSKYRKVMTLRLVVIKILILCTYMKLQIFESNKTDVLNPSIYYHFLNKY